MLPKKKFRIGITGGIGSGKSFFCQLLEERGVPIFDTDGEAKKEMRENHQIHEALRDLIGPNAVGKDGSTNKEAVRNFLSASIENARKVDAIVHPAVRHRLLDWMAGQEASIIAVESALLFESGFCDLIDFTVFVSAPKETRIQRVMKRNGLSREKVEAIMALQMSDSEKRGLCDFVVNNDGSQMLIPQLEKLLLRLHF